MSEEPRVTTVTREEALEKIQDLLSRTPYGTVGELRESVYDGEPCCFGCFDYIHPHARVWQELGGWLYLADIDWRTAP